MMPSFQVTPEHIQEIVGNGSPVLLRAMGRVLGLGEPERAALSRGAVPWWCWAVGGVAIGFVVASRVERAYPGAIPTIVGGEAK